ncbi:MAG: dihydroorotase [Alphaproteobacteria bacterium]|nr:dihydroorotase [Alphaproteobacteria bacterium]MBU1525679.1 dihydroorotase [Alphaproteobacteria bacterium]MBU2118341.1 dihydroorotase [Alphaproteobacteria bacterium]MBU2351940.1 dihydroorotase [Alphaproteobacteria bacterium]MBU2383717.1 dihydroorotase [Alphaproteobacteria bacterium]
MTAFAIVGARLLDPASGLDAIGAVLIEDGRIVDVAAGGSAPAGVEIVNADGLCLAPGLIDVRVKTGEPGAEPKETLKSASLAAAAGGVTSIVVQPDVDPAVDDPAMVDFIHRRGAALDLVRVLAAGALTRGCAGERMAEIGLMAEAGAAYFTDGDRVVTNSRALQRVMTYAAAFDALVATRPVEPWLTEGTVATAGDAAAWSGLAAAPALAERIQLDRDLALAELTGVRLLIDLISTEAALESLDRARARGLEVAASVSINHLCFNDLDAGDWRTFYRLDPPLRAESDRLAMIEGVRDGRIEIITSAHAPAPAEDKRRPFAQAVPGAVGLETLLPAALSLHHEHELTLLELLRPLTLGPAELLGLDGGRLTADAPADLVLFDPDAPVVIDAGTLRSKSRNSPFDGRRLQGKVAGTWVAGRRVFG